MGKKLTADKIKALEENANILMEQGASQGDIDLMTSEFIEEFGVDDAMPEKKNEVQGLNVEVGTSVGSSVKPPASSIKTEQNVGLSPSGKKGIDILRGASVKPISPTKTAIPQTPKKKKSKVEELRKSIQRKVAVGEPLTTDEVGEVREISSNAFLPLDGLKDGEVNVVLAGAQNKQNQQLISKSRNDQYQKQLKDRIVSGEVLPEDIKGMYDVSGFAPPDTDFEKLANDWNAENIKIKQKVDSEILNESSKLDEYIANLDNEIRGLESEQSRQAVQTRRTPKNAMDIEAQSATDGAIGNLKSIKYKAQQYLDYLSEKAIDSSKGEIIKRVNNIQGIRDERGLVKSTSELERVVDDYISTQPNEKRNLLLRKKPYLIESLIATEYIVPKANEDFYKKTNEIISDVPEGAKQLFKRITGEIDVKDGEEKYYDTQQQFAIANNAASLYFMDEIARTNQAFESVVSMPNVRAAIGGKLDVLKQQYDAGKISASDYKLKRLQVLSLNPQTSAYAQEYVQKIKVAQDRYEAKIDKFLQSKVPDFAKFTEVDESGNIVSIAGMKPMEFTQKMTELQTAKEESLNEAAKSYSGEIEDRAVERREELFGSGVKSWVASNFAKGTHGLFEGMSRWAYDNTGFEFFDTARRGATESLYNSSVPFESQEVQGIMNVEAGDYAKAFNPLYMVGVASESAPYMLTTMGIGLATGGLAEGALLGMGFSEGIGAAISLSRAGRIAQKTIAAISSGTSDAYLNMTANYNDLIKEGYSKEQAKQIAFDAFKNELPVDILSGAVEMDALFSATSKPTIKNIIKGGASKAGSILIEEPIQEVYQGYSLEQAKGTNKSLSEYAFFDKEGFNNLMGGLAGGLGTGAVTNAMGIAKNALSWNRLYNVSTADMQNAVRYAGVTQMVSTPSEMQNSINLDILKSAQGIAQEKYQSIPSTQSSEKEKSRTEYINRTVAYEYGKALNVAIQNGTNIDDVHEHYKAHNEAISKAYGTLASLANEKNKPMYQKQADYYASLAQKSEIGKQTPIYSLITPKGRIFITEQTAKTLAEGSIQQKNDAFNKAVRAGDIVGVQVVDDSQTAQSLIKKFDDAKLSQQLAVQQNQGGATAVGQPNQTNVQTPIEGTTEIPTTEGIVNEPNINPESAVAAAPTQEQVEVAGLGTEAIGGEVATTSNQSETPKVESGSVGGGGDVKEPESYAEATDAYKATELGGSEDAKNKKQALVEQAETEEGKKFVESEVSKLEKNDDGTITVFRSGTLQEGHNPATTSRKTAEIIAAERKKQGLSSDIVEVKVNPSDISVVVKGIESEVFVKVDKSNKERIDKNTVQKQKTKAELLTERDEVQKELEKTKKALDDSERAFNDGTYPFSENVFKDANKKQKAKIKNLEWQLSKIEQSLKETPKEETQQTIEIDESTPFDLSTALQTKKQEQDAIQKPSATEEVLLNERPEMGLQEMGEGNAQEQAATKEVAKEEKVEVAPLSFAPKNFIEELIGVEGAVALSGINEEQRQELIKDRLRTTTLTPQKEKEREIVKLIKSHNGMRRNARERLDVRGRIMRLVNDYNKEYPNQKLTFKSWYGDVKVTRPSFDRKQKSTYQKDLTVANLDVSNASLDETEKTFSERSDEFQRKFIELMDLGVQFEFRDAGNKKFSQKMLDDAMNDVDNGIPSRRAAVILNTVEKAIEENVITVGGSLTEGFQYIPLDLAIEETKLMNYEDELRNLSNAEIVALYENEILAQKELDNIIQQEYETEYQSDPNDEFGNVRQLAPRKTREVITPNQEGNNQGQAVEGTIEENQNVNNETPKTTTNREAGENLVGGNQADIPTDADGNGQREEEITKDTPKQGEEGVGVVAGAPTSAISEMDRAVLDAMKPTFEIEFIPNAKFLNTSAPLENKSSQDAVKRRYQTIKKLLECL